MSQLASNLDALRDIPGYKTILRTLIKTQIHQLMKQLSEQTGEESVILMGSINDGTLTHLSSDKATGFYEGRHDVGEQFFKYLAKNFLRNTNNPSAQSGRTFQNKVPNPQKQKVYSLVGVGGKDHQTKQSYYKLSKKRPADPHQGSQVWTPKLVCNNEKSSAKDTATEHSQQALSVNKNNQETVPRPDIVPNLKHSKECVPKPSATVVPQNSAVPVPGQPATKVCVISLTEQGNVSMSKQSVSQDRPGGNFHDDYRSNVIPRINTNKCAGPSKRQPESWSALSDSDVENSESLKKAFNLTRPARKAETDNDSTDYPINDLNTQEATTMILKNLDHDFEKHFASDSSIQSLKDTNGQQNSYLKPDSVSNLDECKLDTGFMSDSDTIATTVSDTFATAGSDIYSGDISDWTAKETDIDATGDNRHSSLESVKDLLSDKPSNKSNTSGATKEIRINATGDCTGSSETFKDLLSDNFLKECSSTVTDGENVPDDKTEMLNAVFNVKLDRAVTETMKKIEKDTTSNFDLDHTKVKDAHRVLAAVSDNSSIKTATDVGTIHTTNTGTNLDICNSVNEVIDKTLSNAKEKCARASVSSVENSTSELKTYVSIEKESDAKSTSKEFESVSQPNDTNHDSMNDSLHKQPETPISDDKESLKNTDLQIEITDHQSSNKVIGMEMANIDISFSPDIQTDTMSCTSVDNLNSMTFGLKETAVNAKEHMDTVASANTTADQVGVGSEKVVKGNCASEMTGNYSETVSPVSGNVKGMEKSKSQAPHKTGSELAAFIDNKLKTVTEVSSTSNANNHEKTKIDNLITTTNGVNTDTNSTLSDKRTYSPAKNKENSLSSACDISSCTGSVKDSASDDNNTHTNAELNPNHLLNGNISNQVSATNDISNGNDSILTNFEQALDTLASKAVSNLGRNNQTIMLTNDDSITSYIKFEPEETSVSEFIDNLELQPMKIDDHENTKFETSETVITNPDEVQKFENDMEGITGKHTNVIRTDRDMLKDREKKDSTDKTMKTSDTIKEGVKTNPAEVCTYENALDLTINKHRKKIQTCEAKGQEVNKSVYTVSIDGCKRGRHKELETAQNLSIDGTKKSKGNKVIVEGKKKAKNVSIGSQKSVENEIVVEGKKTANYEIIETSTQEAAKKVSSDETKKMKGMEIIETRQQEGNTKTKKVSTDGSKKTREIIVEIVEPAMDEGVVDGVKQLGVPGTAQPGTIIMGDSGKQYIIGEGFDASKIVGRRRGRPSKYDNKNPAIPHLAQASICSDGAVLVDMKHISNEQTTQNEIPKEQPKVYKIKLFGRKSRNKVEKTTKKISSQEALAKFTRNVKSHKATTSDTPIQNARENTSSMESRPKYIHLYQDTVDATYNSNSKDNNQPHVYTETVDATYSSNNMVDSQVVPEVSLVFHPREPIMTAYSDESVYRKSAYGDMNNNRKSSTKNTATETLYKNKVVGSKKESDPRNPENAKTKSMDEGPSTEEQKVNDRTVSVSSVYEALFKENAITKGFKTYGAEFPSKHPELCITHVKKEPGVIDCVSIKQETKNEINDISVEKDSDVSLIMSMGNSHQHTKYSGKSQFNNAENSDDIQSDIHTSQAKTSRKRKADNACASSQKHKKAKQSRHNVPKRLSMKTVPGNALFANFNEPTEVYTKPTPHKSSEKGGIDLSASVNDAELPTEIKEEPEKDCNVNSSKTTKVKRACNLSKTSDKQSKKENKSQVSDLFEVVDLKQPTRLINSSLSQMPDTLEVRPMDVCDVSAESPKSKQELIDNDKVKKKKFSNSKTVLKKKPMDHSNAGKEGSVAADLEVSNKRTKRGRPKGKRANSGYTNKDGKEHSVTSDPEISKNETKTKKLNGTPANVLKRNYVKKAIKSGSLLICEECGKWFSYPSKLLIHRLVHSKELPYKCLVCLQRFQLKHQIKNHTRKKHPELVYPCYQTDFDKNEDLEDGEVKEECED